MTDKNVTKAFEAAEQELQEKDVQHLKGIIKNLLQSKKDKEKERDEIDAEIKVIKQDIDDFKAGRLDKIKERHDINPEADKSSPINIVIINDNSRRVYPTQPWRWNYEVQWVPAWGTSTITTTSGTNGGGGSGGLMYYAGTGSTNAINTVYCSGTTAATFTSGTYQLGNNGSVTL